MFGNVEMTTGEERVTYIFVS